MILLLLLFLGLFLMINFILIMNHIFMLPLNEKGELSFKN